MNHPRALPRLAPLSVLTTLTVILTMSATASATGGELTMSGANGAKAVMTMVPGSTLQATMTVNGTAVTSVPACK